MACCLSAPSLFSTKPLPEQVEGPVIWNVMSAMLHHCDNNATKREFGITNDYISSERVWRFALLLARAFCRTNSQATGDWKTSWRWCGITAITTPFRYYKWLCLQWECGCLIGSGDGLSPVRRLAITRTNRRTGDLKRHDCHVASL